MFQTYEKQPTQPPLSTRSTDLSKIFKAYIYQVQLHQELHQKLRPCLPAAYFEVHLQPSGRLPSLEI